MDSDELLARFENAIKYKTGENNKEHPGLSRLQMIILLNEFGVHASPMQKKFDYHSALQKIQYSLSCFVFCLGMFLNKIRVQISAQ